MKIGKLIGIAVAAALMPLMGSCRHEICYDHYPSMDIGFNWEREWERDYGHHHQENWDAAYHGQEYHELRPGVPEWINLIRYHSDGHTTEKYLQPSGAQFSVEEGSECSMLLYNGDTEYIVLSDVASVSDARATATSRSRASLGVVMERHPDARTTNPPDILYATYIDHVPSIKNHELRQIPAKMQPLVYTYIITYEFEHGIENVAFARGALGGMAESVYLRTGVTSEETSIILFDCDKKTNCCRAIVRSFGVPAFPDAYYGRKSQDENDKAYTLNLEVMLRNGKTLEFNYDISDQMKNQPRGGVIKVTGLRVEDEQNQSQGGFNVGVDDWGDGGEEIDLPLGNQTKVKQK